jgi:hypothetical protein
MRNKVTLVAFVTAVLVLTPAARSQNSSQPAAPQQEQKVVAKPHKVWTSDDLGTLRSPADVYLEAEQKQAEEQAAAAAQQAAAAKQAAGTQPAKKKNNPPKLSNPKTTQDADNMIAWEERDIQSQTEYVAQLRQQLADAPADDKPRLEKMIQERIQIIADTKQERDGLAAQKNALAKKSFSAQSTPSQ